MGWILGTVMNESEAQSPATMGPAGVVPKHLTVLHNQQLCPVSKGES